MTARTWTRRLTALASAALLAVTAGCATAPATGDPIFTGGLTPSKEREIGQEQHPKLVRQFGGEYQDAEVQRYVRELGMELARESELPNLDWSFTVLDTPIVNAFALPGGYVHVSRGLVELADSEAQLAGVLAHEIGHVTARHSAERYGGQVLAGVAGLAAGILLGGQAAQMTNVLGSVALSSYSRSQEFEADTLGVRYIARAGYDPQAMAGFLEKMQANTQLEAKLRGNPEAADQFSLLATHPRTAERVREAINAAGARLVAEPELGRERHLAMIDGMIHGHGPEQGFVRGRSFQHPELRFAFEVPEGFRLFNSPTQVVAFGPEGARILFDRAGKDVSLDVVDYLTRSWAPKLRLRQVERLAVNGLPAATGTAQVRTKQGRRDLRLVAIRFDADAMYRFIFVTPPSLTAQLNEPLRRTTYSFRKLSPEEAAALQPLRLRIHTVQPGETQESLAERMPFADFKLERFRVLNGLDADDRLQPGQKVKLVVG